MRLVLPCCLALLLAACAGRAPNPVALVQDKDKAMDCAAIRAEITANNSQITELGREDGAKVGQNIAMGVAPSSPCCGSGWISRTQAARKERP